ncbi:MAG: lipoate--protein ligase family protein [bacterium]|nr:lipoate--protein ligase family protein [Candidatus Kapabacteria bacterium]
MDSWLLALEPLLDGNTNMQRDEAMADACRIDGIPRLRLYSWSPWTLSLGHNQSDAEIDREALAASGYDVVRRPTGGRAVFHAEELTYAVAMPASGAGVHETYARISDAIRRGLKTLGARDLEFARAQPDFRAHYESDDSSSCFSASALNELTWRGRKLLGSAQRRYGAVLLQHGSLLIGDAHLQIVDFLHAAASPERRDAVKRRLEERTATLANVFDGVAPRFDELALAIANGFAETFEVTMEISSAITLTAQATQPYTALA